MKIKTNLSDMTIEELKKLVIKLFEDNTALKEKNALLEQELSRIKKSRLSQK